MRLLTSTSFLVFAAASAASAQISPQEGFTLIAPTSQTTTWLVDTNGRTVQTWPSAHLPGAMAYLRDDGVLVRSYWTNSTFGFGIMRGDGGGFQEIGWNGQVLWDYQMDDGSRLSHHDIEVLPNGNVLVIAWERKTAADAIAAGRSPLKIASLEFYPDAIFELRKNGKTSAAIVWEWHSWDHLVQDFDPALANFGDPAQSQLIDLNFPPSAPLDGDWLHTNGIDYHPGFDQIVISPRTFDEIWVIDHSTTSAQAAGHTGGLQGVGGDLLYRWGNPLAYRAGVLTDKQLFEHHDPVWVDEGKPGAGNLLVFSNGSDRPAGKYSTVEEIVPPVDSSGAYTRPPAGTPFGPAAPVWTYGAPTPTDFFSQTVSGAERLRNGNTLVSSGDQSWIFEVDPSGNIVWQFFTSAILGTPERFFKARRYEQFLFGDVPSISAATGGAVTFQLEGTHTCGASGYLVVGSLSGTSPGSVLSTGTIVPLNYDLLTFHTIVSANTPTFSQFFGTLDVNGSASAQLSLPTGFGPSLAGLTAHFAFATIPALDFASNPVAVNLVP